MNNSNSGGQKEEQGIPREYIDWAESDALEAYEVSSYQKPLGKTMWLTAANKMAVAAYRKLFERKECIDLLALVPGISPEAVMQILQLNATQLRDYEKALFESEQKVKQLSEKREGPVLRFIKGADRCPTVLNKEYIVRKLDTGDFFGSYYNGRGASVLDNFPDQYEWLEEIPPQSPSITRDGEREERDMARNLHFVLKYVATVLERDFDRKEIIDLIRKKLDEYPEYGRAVEGKKEGEQ